MSEMLSWVEIPAADFERAFNFYQTLLGPNVHAGDFMGIPHGFLDDAQGRPHGAVIPNVIPNVDASVYDRGPLVYLRVENLDDVLARVEAAGGSVIMPKTSIGPQGVVAAIRDSEGNHVGLHSIPEQASV
jgi:predicted enzyme related to lactoylglutathione lyase